jgi:Na+(H+)/acetate symporter ActP
VKEMKNNMAGLDRIIRAIFALVVAVLYYFGQISGTAAIILGIIALIFIVTSIVGFCPLYRLLGISTKK